MISVNGNEVQIGVSTYDSLTASAEVMSDITRILKAGRQWLTNQGGLQDEAVNDLYIKAIFYSNMSDEEFEEFCKNEEKEDENDGESVRD